MKKCRILFLMGTVFASAFLSACHEKRSANQDVTRFVSSIEAASKQRKATDSEKILAVPKVVYEGEKYHDPFELPATVKNLKQYPNTILRDTALDSIKLIGVVLHVNQRWAIFRSNNGKVYKMTEGMRMGIQNALLTEITQDQAKFMIDVGSEQGEKRQEVVMTLQESQ